MKKLTGSLRQRINEAIQLTHSAVDDEQCACFCKFYAEAGEEQLPAAMSFYRNYGNCFKKLCFVFENPGYNKEFVFEFYSDLPYPNHEGVGRLQRAMEDKKAIVEYAKQKVCPVGDFGFYYPATVYVGADGILYCVYEYEDKIRVFKTVEALLEFELLSHIPAGIVDI